MGKGGGKWYGGNAEVTKNGKQSGKQHGSQPEEVEEGPSETCITRLLATLCTHAYINMNPHAVSSHFVSTRIHTVSLHLCIPTLCTPHQDYMDPCEPRQGFLKNVRHMFDLSDVVEDVSEVSKQGGQGEGGVGGRCGMAWLVQGCSGCCSYRNQAAASTLSTLFQTQVVENHATTTSSTVWKLPKTAAKAARHMPSNIFSLLTGGECAIYGFPGKK